MAEGPRSQGPVAATGVRSTLWRLYAHALVARFYFYIPVLVHHTQTELTHAGAPSPAALSVTLIGVISIGVIAAEYPSGLLADWLGCKHVLLLSAVFQVAGVLLYLIPASISAMVGAQILIGVATAFRSGADTTLLHAHMERHGQSARYGGGLARLRFFNTFGIGLAGLAGGPLYAWQPRSVFVAAAVSSLLGALLIVSIDEARPATRRSYRQVLTQSLDAMRDSRQVRALIWLGSAGNPFFVFAFWVTQRYLIDAEFSFLGMGLTVASISFLQAFTMPLSAWVSRGERRLRHGLTIGVVLLPCAFAAVAELWSRQQAIGALTLVLLCGSHVLFRNMVNVRLQRLVPPEVRASVVSFEAFIGAIGYLVLFAVGGYLLASEGLPGTFWTCAALLAATTWPLLRALQRARTSPRTP